MDKVDWMMVSSIIIITFLILKGMGLSVGTV